MSSAPIGIRNIMQGLQALGLTRESAVIVHASLSSFGEVRGGAAAVLGALLATCDTVVMPAFTCQSMVWPLTGPQNNGIAYGGPDLLRASRDARIFHLDLPVHRDIGLVAETLRRHPDTVRSAHPALSFVAAGKHAREALAGQTLQTPLAPIAWLQQHGGDVVLIGVGHARNVSLHYAEQVANRKQFLRWAIARDVDSPTVRAFRLPNFPGCSDGFDAIESEIAHATRQVTIGRAVVRRVPLATLIPVAAGRISQDPNALLCVRPDCARCNDVRRQRHAEMRD